MNISYISVNLIFLFLIFISASNKHGDLAPRIGFMHHFEQKSFVVKQWDSELEDIKAEGK